MAQKLKQSKRKKPKFKGYDWTELSEYFGLDIDGEKEQTLKEFIEEIHGLLHNGKKSKKIAERRIKALRKYLKEVVDISFQYGYEAPVWSGLARIKDDHTFLRFYTALVYHMWT